jgi:hypothetical protein
MTAGPARVGWVDFRERGNRELSDGAIRRDPRSFSCSSKSA